MRTYERRHNVVVQWDDTCYTHSSFEVAISNRYARIWYYTRKAGCYWCMKPIGFFDLQYFVNFKADKEGRMR